MGRRDEGWGTDSGGTEVKPTSEMPTTTWVPGQGWWENTGTTGGQAASGPAPSQASEPSQPSEPTNDDRNDGGGNDSGGDGDRAGASYGGSNGDYYGNSDIRRGGGQPTAVTKTYNEFDRETRQWYQVKQYADGTYTTSIIPQANWKDAGIPTKVVKGRNPDSTQQEQPAAPARPKPEWVQDTTLVPTRDGDRTYMQMYAELMQAGYNGPLDPPTLLAAYNRTVRPRQGPTPPQPAPWQPIYIPQPVFYNSGGGSAASRKALPNGEGNFSAASSASPDVWYALESPQDASEGWGHYPTSPETQLTPSNRPWHPYSDVDAALARAAGVSVV